MKKTPNAERSTSNVQLSSDGTTSNSPRDESVRLADLKPQTSNTLWRIVDLLAGGVFIYAGAIKALNPIRFASDIDNYKILPWTIAVALAFYLPWLEILCGFGLIVRFLYRGALSILVALILVFTLATVAAKLRGLDISCGCFGHASQHWNFPAHMATNFGILIALLALWFSARSTQRRWNALSSTRYPK